MKTILCVFGTRPEAIKMAPVVAELRRHPTAVRALVCVTGQHRQMLDPVLRLFGMQPDFDLGIMGQGQGLDEITTKVLQGLTLVLREARPDLVLVHGDTTTTLAASLASFYERIPVGHIEAGLRTGNLKAPWPEELNRRVVDVIADLHFAPTAAARDNLLREGVPSARIDVTGNTVIDALQWTVDHLRSDPGVKARLAGQFPFLSGNKRLVLVTGHRRESHGPGLESVCRALRRIAERHPDVDVLFAVHLNPKVQGTVHRLLSGVRGIHLIGPQDYLEFVHLMDRAHLIITDSGGIQEEAPTLGKPVLVTRETTERPEAVAAGSALLVGVDEERIVREVSLLLDDPKRYERMSGVTNPYGDGHASRRIVANILRSWTVDRGF